VNVSPDSEKQVDCERVARLAGVEGVHFFKKMVQVLVAANVRNNISTNFFLASFRLYAKPLEINTE
jgi:hypothetical protein